MVASLLPRLQSAAEVQAHQAYYWCQGCPQVRQELSYYPLPSGRARRQTGVGPVPHQQEGGILIKHQKGTLSQKVSSSDLLHFREWLSFTFATFLIIASLPACDPLWWPPLSLCFTCQPLNLRRPSPANHSHSKALHPQSHSEGSWTSRWSLTPWRAKWPHSFWKTD